MKKNTPPTDESAIHNPIREKQKALLALEKAKKNQKKKPKLIPAGISGEKLKEYLQNIKNKNL